MARFILIAICAVALSAQSLQKLRTFYSSDAAEVPAALASGKKSAVASDGIEWAAASRGLVRNSKEYFAGKRYLPDDEVLALAPDSARGMWVRTRTGVSHIELREMTLEQKAAAFEQRIAKRHDRYGMVADSHLAKAGDLASNVLESSDNDGLWTAMYAAAECFRYAVTKDPNALAAAHHAIEAVLFLEDVTGVAGLPARSYVKKDDPRPKDGAWHWTADKQIQWKGDTSSDEIVGHFFILSIAYDLLDDPALKARLATAARRMMDHIISHGYDLIDVTGKPTTWGKWSPEYFATNGKYDSALNALELLSFLKTTEHMTGDPKYAAEYKKAAVDRKYAQQAARYLELRYEINYSDEELAMLSFYPFFRYENSALMRSALDQWWENCQREKNPLWIYIYGVGHPDQKVDAAGALSTLERIPMDLITWKVVNSDRKDVVMEKDLDRAHEKQARTLLPPDERPVMKWNGNPFVVDGGDGGYSEDDGAFFLLPYWMGRFLGVVPASR
ncbi:MAG: hypothetical protein ABSF22_23170 [Bryobacteraceae bacterium]